MLAWLSLSRWFDQLVQLLLDLFRIADFAFAVDVIKKFLVIFRVYIFFGNLPFFIIQLLNKPDMIFRLLYPAGRVFKTCKAFLFIYEELFSLLSDCVL